MDGADLDPIVTGAVVKVGELGEKMADSAAKETGGLLTRLFGPSADVLGTNWAERLRERNLRKLLEKTEKRADGKPDPGVANPRVASQAFEAAEYADAEVVSEYLSGVLASSRTPDGSSDRGVGWIALIKRLSSDDLRLHYVLYASARDALIESNFERIGAAHNVEVAFSFRQLLLATEITVDQLAGSIDVLMREGLLGDGYRYGARAFAFESELKRANKVVTFPDEPAARVRLTVHGYALFLWGNGCGELPNSAYLDARVTLEPADPEARLHVVFARTMKELVVDATS